MPAQVVIDSQIETLDEGLCNNVMFADAQIPSDTVGVPPSPQCSHSFFHGLCNFMNDPDGVAVQLSLCVCKRIDAAFEELTKCFLNLRHSYRSIAPNTTSIDPITATTSAINCPLHIVSSACRLAKSALRMWTR